jgi:hypothetical protein
VRLVSQTGQTDGNPTAGRLEILINGEWGTICDEDFDITDADVACRQLALSSAVESFGNTRNLGYVRMLL